MRSIPNDICRIPARDRRRDGRGFSQINVGFRECPPFLGLGIGAAGIDDVGPGADVTLTAGAARVTFACLDGMGRIGIGGRWHDWRPGHAVLLPAGARCRYAHARGRWRFAWVCWRDARLQPAAQPTLRAWDGAGLGESITGCWRERHALDPAAMHHWATLVALIARRAEAPVDDPRLSALAAAVDADLAQPWTLGDLARLAGCGIETLRGLVHAAAGVSPVAWLARRRMRRAAALIAGSDLAITAIAEQVGYGNAFAFSVAFKRAMGVPPSVYRGERTGRFLIPGDPLGRAPSRGGVGVGRRR
ncbi:MAG TPA: helix-turn-helix transcriptional regulator [Planctomycetota bacterium]|nr:helix-turn-helix transcriptional regulator [Planctomycetota bacterium]